MIKRMLAIFLTICLIFSNEYMTAFANTSEEINPNTKVAIEYECELVALDKIAITKYYGNAKELIIPSEISGYEVVVIGSQAFKDCDTLVSVTCPNTLIDIYSSAFYDCDNLTSVTLPEGMEEIRDYAFYSCDKLKNINIPTSLIVLGEGVFSQCASLETIDLSKLSITTLNDDLFLECSALKKVTLPVKLKTIEGRVFEGCSVLDDVLFPATLFDLKERAFMDCDGLKTVDLSKTSITGLSDYVFSNCEAMTSILLPSSLTEIGYGALDTCYALKSLDLSHTLVSTIDDYGMSGCTSLETIKLPKTLQTIGENAFSGCVNLQTIDFTNTKLSQIGKSAFRDCKTLKEVKFPATLNYVGNDAFGFCEALKEVDFSKSSTLQIDKGAFAFCNSLKIINMSNISTLSIEEMAFTSCDYLELLLLPSKIKSLGTDAFSGGFWGWRALVITSMTEKQLNYIENLRIDSPPTPWGSRRIYVADKYYYLQFDGNGASKCDLQSMLCGTGISYKLPKSELTRKGYTFTGWNTKKDGTGKSYKDQASVKNLTSTNGKTVTLYAQWKKTKYKITYKLNGGENNKKNKSSYYITTSTFKLKNPTKKGYTFKGWYSDKKCTKKVTKITKGTTGNKTYYAKWVKTQYEISYVLNKGKNSKSNKKTYYVTTKTFKLKNPTRKGYVFKGWYSDKKCTKKVTKIKKGSTGNIKLYAKWKKK